MASAFSHLQAIGANILFQVKAWSAEKTKTLIHAFARRGECAQFKRSREATFGRASIYLTNPLSWLQGAGLEEEAYSPPLQGGVNAPNSREVAKPPLKGAEGVVASYCEASL
jgi:hypothetical protein